MTNEKDRRCSITGAGLQSKLSEARTSSNPAGCFRSGGAIVADGQARGHAWRVHGTPSGTARSASERA
jgi:hypothetical protein